jgi:NADH:ubiquinone oxidoreductase subunit F (NADH-binding)/(2Fe-2S) ferredoxin/Pyruvate/2-oxoacid:ferredoxin oxidoreductase delta subunit
MSKLTSPAELVALRQRLASLCKKRRGFAVCSGTGCLAAKSAPCAEALAKEVARLGLESEIELRRTGCYGFCERGPIVVVEPEGIVYLGVQAKDAAEIVDRAVSNQGVVERLVHKDAQGRPCRTLEQIPFYRLQKRVLLDANTRIDPKEIDSYIVDGGYSALSRALFEMTPKKIVSWIKEAGLRGRGGGGFPAAVKWETTRNAPGDVKYVVVNGDEGDPGAYMDRSLLEGNPHSVLEGLLIGAYAIGAHQGFIYVRQEYPLAVENTRIALEQAREYGLLGNDVLGSGFNFNVTIHRGAGAFVSGESTALMNAIEGRVGQPRPKYVHTSVSGLWEKPTNLNNVETWANVPLIVNNGVDWYREMGTENSKGTKVFSLVGKVCNSGLVEVPMGITLREMIFGIGGGIPKGRKFKAVQTGGPSGGFLPESLLDLRVDFDELTAAGSMMGSGGMVVMDEDSCMVDATRFYVRFLAHESCGQCVPCREGLRQMLRILNNIVSGHGEEGDIELLEELCELLQDASLCALGSSAPNPVLSAIKHFRHEFEAHIREKRCPAMSCLDLMHYRIDPERCDGCHLCKKECPTEAIVGDPKAAHFIDQDKCIKCGRCLQICPDKRLAVIKVQGTASLAGSVARSA